MNFLGHCFLCQRHPHLIAGNLAGDSYKGQLTNFENLPKHILDGVKLHRFIDDYTDTSESIIAVAHLFQKNSIQKITFIASDILLDHYLAKNWTNYSSQFYAQFIKVIYLNVEKDLNLLSNDFKFLYSKMVEYDWLSIYPQEAGIRKVLHQYSSRVQFDNDLDKCMDIYLANKTEIDSHFKTFLADIIKAAANFILESNMELS